LRELGVTPFHRQDFGTVRMMLSAEQQITLDLEPPEFTELTFSTRNASARFREPLTTSEDLVRPATPRLSGAGGD